MEILREWAPTQVPEVDFDLAIGVLGYETRSTWLIERGRISAKKYLGLRFGYHETLHFDLATAIYQRLRGEVIAFAGESTKENLKDYFSNCWTNSEQPIIVLDLSAMSRLMMATVLQALVEARVGSPFTVYAHYTPAMYLPGSDAVPVRIAQPVIPELAGWSSRPDAPLGVIAGLGYESGAAAGALQFLEPSKAWVFSPVGKDERFFRDVGRANATLSALFDVVNLYYDLSQPLQTRFRIASLAAELSADYRLAFVPLGPKLFAWLCTLTAMEDRFGETSVWRFSSQELGEPRERASSGLSLWHAVSLQNTVCPT